MFCFVGEVGKMVDVSIMLFISDLIYIVLIKIEVLGEISLVFFYFFEWRIVLVFFGNRMFMMFELKGIGSKFLYIGI